GAQSAHTKHHQQPAWPPAPTGRKTTYKSLSAGYPALHTSASPHGSHGGHQRTGSGSPGRLCREILRGLPQVRSLLGELVVLSSQTLGPIDQISVLDPQTRQLFL